MRNGKNPCVTPSRSKCCSLFTRDPYCLIISSLRKEKPALMAVHLWSEWFLWQDFLKYRWVFLFKEYWVKGKIAAVAYPAKLLFSDISETEISNFWQISTQNLYSIPYNKSKFLDLSAQFHLYLSCTVTKATVIHYWLQHKMCSVQKLLRKKLLEWANVQISTC